MTMQSNSMPCNTNFHLRPPNLFDQLFRLRSGVFPLVALQHHACGKVTSLSW